MKNTLWTRDFTIITVGSTVSILGNTLASFAMDLMILDRTESTALFAVYLILYTLPMLLSPILAGPLLDRYSRKKTIYVLDFITAAIFGVTALYTALLPFTFVYYAAVNILLGAVGGVYSVAYQSFYPLTITEGYFDRAYAVDSTLETLSAFMMPVSALIYNTLGLVPLFFINAGMYLFAAVIETFIRTEEDYTKKLAEAKGVRLFIKDFRDGISYLREEKGLLAIALYFFFSSLAGGAAYVVVLPWFREAFENGEYIYTAVWLGGDIARVLCGLVIYRFKIPSDKKYSIALTVYVATCFLEAVHLWLPLPLMAIACVMTGFLGMMSYNIRLSATQQYVPDDKKGRFNGAFGTLSSVGQLAGQGLGGVLSLFMGQRLINTAANALCLVAAVVLIGGAKAAVSKVYNAK